MFMPRRFWINGTILLVTLSVLLTFSVSTWAADDVLPEFAEPQKIELTVNKSYVLPVPESVKTSDHIRVTIGSPGIADFIFIPSVNKKNRVRNIFLKGNKPGVTNMTLWKNGKIFRVYDIVVTFDVGLLKQKLHDILPEEKDVRVFASKNKVVLSGTVSSTANLNQALILAEAFAGGEDTKKAEGNIVNLLTVAGGHQIMLEVKISEVRKEVLNRLGINFGWINDGEFGINVIGGLSGFTFETLGIDIYENNVGTAFGRYIDGNDQWTGVLDFLKGNGLLKVLAEPTLIAMSGQTANFLAGGEFPIPKIDDDGNVGVDFKPYGVELAFTPTVLSDKKISIKVEPAVSELDFAVSTTIAGATVPGILSRKANTMIELGDGQSFAIAGLLSSTARESASRYPGLGDLPVLGTLFKSTSYLNAETELVILVTPHLVKPLDMTKQTLPTDFYTDPDDAEFFLWGIFGRSHENREFGEAELDGEFGHIFEEKKKE